MLGIQDTCLTLIASPGRYRVNPLSRIFPKLFKCFAFVDKFAPELTFLAKVAKGFQQINHIFKIALKIFILLIQEMVATVKVQELDKITTLQYQMKVATDSKSEQQI